MKILRQTENEIWVLEKGETLKYWIHGTGLIPVHRNPSLRNEFLIRGELKQHLKLK